MWFNLRAASDDFWRYYRQFSLLQHGGDVHHRIIHLKRRHVRKIADRLARVRGQTTPAIDFDCSDVVFKG